MPPKAKYSGKCDKDTIALYCDQPAYAPGEEFTGRVEVTLAKRREVGELFLKMEGTNKVAWNVRSQYEEIQPATILRRDRYLKERHVVQSIGTLSKGRHVFAFRIALPSTLQQSFRCDPSGTNDGVVQPGTVVRVRDLVERGTEVKTVKWDSRVVAGVVCKKRFKVKVKLSEYKALAVKAPILVIHPCTERWLPRPVQYFKECVVRGMLCTSKGALTVNCEVNKTHFRPGEDIHFRSSWSNTLATVCPPVSVRLVRITVLSSSPNVNGTKTLLTRGGEGTVRMREVLALCDGTAPLPPGTFDWPHDCLLNVPPSDQVSTTEHFATCKFVVRVNCPTPPGLTLSIPVVVYDDGSPSFLTERVTDDARKVSASTKV